MDHVSTAAWLGEQLRAHSLEACILIGLWIVCTVANLFVGIWKKKSDPEKLAMMSGSRLGRGAIKFASAYGWHPVKSADAVIDWIAAGLNALARARHVPIPYPAEPRAVLTTGPTEPPRVVVVLPEEKTSVPAVIPVGMLDAARARAEAAAEAAAERAEAANKTEKPL